MQIRKGELFLDYIRLNPGTGAMAMFRALNLGPGGNRNHNLNYLALKRLLKRGIVVKEKIRGRIFLYPRTVEPSEIHTDLSGWHYDE